MRSWLLAVLVILISTNIPPASGESSEIEADLRVQGRGQFIGALAANASLDGAQFYTDNATNGPSLQAEAERFQYELWDLRYVRYTLESSNPAGAQWYEYHMEPELVERGNQSGSMQLQSRFQEEALVRVLPDNAWEVSIESRGSVSMGRPVSPRAVPANRDIVAQLPQATGDFTLTGSPWTFQAWSPNAMQEDIRMMIYGVNATLGSSTFTTGRWQDEDYVQGPVGWSHGGLWHRYVLLVDAADASVELAGVDDARWSLHTMQIEGRWQGDLTLSQARGDGTVNGTSIPDEQHLFQVIGAFNVEADYSREVARWEIKGEASFVAVDGAGLFGDRYAHLEAEAIAVAVVLGTGLLALLWKLLPRIAVLWSRELWDNEQRARIAHYITWNPGVSLTEIGRAVGIARMSVDWHVDRLLRAEKVSRCGRGAPAFVLNSGSTKFRVGEGEVHADEGFRLLRHAVRRQILDAAHETALDYQSFCQLQENQGEQALSQRVFSGHTKQMLEAGLLERHVRGGHVKWTAPVDYAGLRRYSIRAYLTHPNPGRWKVYQALLEGRRQSELHDEFAASDAKNLDAVLWELRALGLVHQDGESWRAVPF